MTARLNHYVLFAACAALVLMCAFLVKTPHLGNTGYGYYKESRVEMPHTPLTAPAGYYHANRPVR